MEERVIESHEERVIERVMERGMERVIERESGGESKKRKRTP